MPLTTDTSAESFAADVLITLQMRWPTRAIRVVGGLTGEVDIAVEGDDGQDWIVRIYHPWS